MDMLLSEEFLSEIVVESLIQLVPEYQLPPSKQIDDPWQHDQSDAVSSGTI